jgi:hypothetical protein
MRLLVSNALLVLLLGMPLGCILVGYDPGHPCCPRTNATVKCPYDALDKAKVASGFVAEVPMVVGTLIVPPDAPVAQDFVPEIVESHPDLYVLNRILRI